VTPTVRLATLRLVRAPRSVVAALGWTFLAIVAALAERSAASPAAGHVLLGTFGAIVLPLLVYVLVGAALAGQGVARAVRPVVAFGGDPTRAAASALLVAAAASAVACAILSALVAALAHGPSDPPLASDAITSAWIGALAGLAYAAWFTLGAAIARSGIGRAIFLGVDWLLGVGTGAGAALTARGHVRNLLGGAPPLDFSQRASTVALVVLALAFAGGALLLALRARV
jgi:hypothetical protein